MDLIRNYIGGQWLAAKSGRTQSNLNPASGAVLGEVVASGVEEVNAAVQAAYGAKFAPTLQNGKPLKVSGVLTYNFVP